MGPGYEQVLALSESLLALSACSLCRLCSLCLIIPLAFSALLCTLSQLSHKSFARSLSCFLRSASFLALATRFLAHPLRASSLSRKLAVHSLPRLISLIALSKVAKSEGEN